MTETVPNTGNKQAFKRTTRVTFFSFVRASLCFAGNKTIKARMHDGNRYALLPFFFFVLASLGFWRTQGADVMHRSIPPRKMSLFLFSRQSCTTRRYLCTTFYRALWVTDVISAHADVPETFELFLLSPQNNFNAVQVCSVLVNHFRRLSSEPPSLFYFSLK